MENNDTEIIEFHKEGYKPLVDFSEWRVAVLKYCDKLRIENITTMQKHTQTDEVFVLLNGSCTLFTGGNGDAPSNINWVTMRPHMVYNIKKGVWHNHTLDNQGEVLVVENRNTCIDNSPIVPLNKEQIRLLLSSGELPINN